MATSVLELLRAAQEEMEKLEEVAAQLLLQQQALEGEEEEQQQQQQQQQQLAPLGLRPKRRSERRRREALRLKWALGDCLQKLEETGRQVLELHEDGDSLKAEETLFLGGQRRVGRAAAAAAAAAGSSSDVWVNFYDRIKEIRNLYKRRQLEQPEQQQLPLLPLTSQQLLQQYLDTPYLEALFSPEEALGRHVALSSSYRRFCGLKKIQAFFQKQIKEKELLRLRKKGASEEQLQQRALLLEETKETGDYLGFLRGLGDFSKIPRHLKYKQKDFKDFLQETAEYLQDFFFRLNPLADQNKVLESFEKDFDSLFSRRQFVGWQEPTRSSSLYCPVSDKLFATPSTFQHYQQGSGYKKKLLQAAERSAAAAEAAAKASEEEDRQIAFLEFRIKTLADMLREQINQTIAYHQKKQSTNAEEALEEDEQDSTDEEEAAAPEEESEAEEDEGPVYNPLNLPLGFDGRPIPYWLYKLHGLGQEFKCEICGNFSYWGRRAFERHFAEWRHSFGMRCLKIPNTTHFKEITKIEDAILLYEKLKQQAEGHAFKQDQELECEDADGNVMSLRAFEDLRRQGLL